MAQKRLFVDLEVCDKCKECKVCCSYFYHPQGNGITSLSEFAAFQFRQLKEKPPIKEIKKMLKDIGIPPPLVNTYFSLVLEKVDVEETKNNE